MELDVGTTLTDAAKGAAMGATLGPIGAAAGGILGALTGIFPGIGNALFGKNSSTVVSAALGAASAITGKANPTEADLIGLPPVEVAKLRLQLAEIASKEEQAGWDDHVRDLQARLGDVASARTMEETLADAKSPIQWAPVLISVVVLIAFGGALFLIVAKAIPTGQAQMADILLGALAGMASQVVSYWVGSSSDSRVKTHLLANKGRAS
jgi:hypothetical protein